MEGASLGFPLGDADVVGFKDGKLDGVMLAVGVSLGFSLGDADAVGDKLGFNDGFSETEGPLLGVAVGELLMLGSTDFDGFKDGKLDGSMLAVGTLLGGLDGTKEWDLVVSTRTI